jgi:hypothetical protein
MGYDGELTSSSILLPYFSVKLSSFLWVFPCYIFSNDVALPSTIFIAQYV